MILHDTVVRGHVWLPPPSHSQSEEIDQANRQISIPEPLH